MFEFLKKKKVKQTKYLVDSENLAVPEVHTGEVPEKEATHTAFSKDASTDSNSKISFDAEDVAVPEIHIRKNK